MNTFTATSRNAGRSIVHTVTMNGETVIGRRRSESRRYGFAFVVRMGEGRYAVTRWSGSRTARSGEIVVPVVHA